MQLKWLIYFLILLTANIVALIKWKHVSNAERVIALLLALTLISEGSTYIVGTIRHNNMPIFHFFNPVEFFLTSLYFNYCIGFLRKRNLGMIMGAIGIVLSVINTLLLQKLTSINSNFLLFEGLIIIIYCLLALHQILLDEEHLPYRFAHFWLTLCFLIYWSSTYTGWGLVALWGNDRIVALFFDKILTAANFVFYTGIGCVFLFHKRLIPAGRA